MKGFLNAFYLDPWTAKTGELSKKECDLLTNAKKAIEKNMTPDQQERRIMATINGTKVLIVVTRPQSVYRPILDEIKKANDIPEMPK